MLFLLQLPKNYAFSYSVKDQSSGDDFSHSQAHNGQSTKGEYRVKLPDGRMQIVSYTADNSGYKADVRYVMDEARTPDNFDHRVPNYVHDFSNNGNVDHHNIYDQYRDNHIRDYTPSPYYPPTAATFKATPTPSVQQSSPNLLNSVEYSEEYHQVYQPQAGHSSGPGLSYYTEHSTPTPKKVNFKMTKPLGHDVNYLLNLVSPTKHSLNLFQHSIKEKIPAKLSYETTTQNSELENELYRTKYSYNPVKVVATQNTDKNQGMRYHYEAMTTPQPDVTQDQGFKPSLQSYYAPSALVNVEPPNLGPAEPIQANYVTLPRDKFYYKFGKSFIHPSPLEDNNFQANNIENTEVKQTEKKTTTEESLTMRPHIKYNTKPSVLQNSKPQKSTILNQPATPTPQLPKQYVSKTPSPQYYTSSITTAVPYNEISQHTAGTTLNSFDYSGEYHSKPIEESAELKPYKTPKKQFSKLVLPVTTIRPNYIPSYNPQTNVHSLQPSYIAHTSAQATFTPTSSPQQSHALHPSYSTHSQYTSHSTVAPQKFVFLQPSISPMYINSLEDNKPSLELSYLKEVPNDSVYLKHNADPSPTSQELSEETPRPYDSYSFSTSVSASPTPLYTQAVTSSEEYSKESLYSFVPSVRHEYDLGNAESSNYSSGSSEQEASSSTSREEMPSTTQKADENSRQRKSATGKESRSSSSSSNSRHPQSNQARRRS